MRVGLDSCANILCSVTKKAVKVRSKPVNISEFDLSTFSKMWNEGERWLSMVTARTGKRFLQHQEEGQ
jgi:hypothetical protein